MTNGKHKDEAKRKLLDLLSKNKLYQDISYGTTDPSTGKMGDDFDKNIGYWKLSSPDELFKRRFGVCYDTAAASDILMNEAGIEHSNWFMHPTDSAPGEYTHTFTTYKDKGRHRWAEGSWGPYKDNSFEDDSDVGLAERVARIMAKKHGKDIVLKKVDRFPDAGTSLEDFVREMEKGSPVKVVKTEKRASEGKGRRLYTYLPKDNTADVDGILSTLLSPDGWEKYKERTGKTTKEEVLKELDSLDPGFTRSKAISMFSEPIPDNADEEMVAFARKNRLYSILLKELKDNGTIVQIRASNRNKKGTHAVKTPGTRPIDWGKKKPGRFLFSDVPHYLVETRDGKIPPEFIREETEKRAAEVKPYEDPAIAVRLPTYSSLIGPYSRNPEKSLERLSRQLARKWHQEDVDREDAAHAREFEETGEDKNLIDRYIIQQIGLAQPGLDHAAKRKLYARQMVLRAAWGRRHPGEDFIAALPRRLGRFRQYRDIPF